jgi:hypothetical protein
VSNSNETTYYHSGKAQPYHASNDLMENIVTDFPHAMRLYLSSMEQAFGGTTAPEDFSAAEKAQWNQILPDARREVALALKIYNDGQADDTVAIAANLRTAGLVDFATALETRCYSGLAV